MGLFDSKVTKLLKKTFEPDRNLYSAYLRKRGITPVNGSEYSNKDIEVYFKESYDVQYDEKENAFSVSEGAFIIHDVRTGENVHETINYEEHETTFEALHAECVGNNELVKYCAKSVNDACFMVYPYTTITFCKNYNFEIDNTTVRFVEDDIEINGIAKVEILEDMDTTEEEGYTKQTLIDSYTEPICLKIPNVYKSMKGNKELGKLLRKSKMFRG